MRRSLIPIAALFVLAFIAASPTNASFAEGPGPLVLPHSVGLSPNPSPAASSLPAANYDEQIGLTFTQSFTSLAYNVTAVAQTDSYGYGPAYILNGLSDNGYWYQIGLSYDWPYQNGGYNPGFNILYEVFGPSGASVFPSGGAGLAPLVVRNGDSVLLSLAFSGAQVGMYVYDWNTGAHASESYAAYGTRFVGLSSTGNSNGFFTGLMTEWYHANEYYGGEAGVTYSNPLFALSSGYLWADEYLAPCCSSVQFYGFQHVNFQPPGPFQSFSTHGATANGNAYAFVSGTLTFGALDLGYSVSGGGTGYSPPVVTYTYNGVARSSTLTTTPTVFYADVGSTWRVSNELPGGTSTQRWFVGGTSGGVVSSSTNRVVTYFHQVLVTFGVISSSAQVSPSSLPFVDPAVSYRQSGKSLTASLASSVWADVGSEYSFTSPTVGSTSSERWASSSPSGTVSDSGVITANYHHQYSLAMSYAITGGGSPSPPTISAEQFGEPVSLQLSTRPETIWLDGSTHWSVGDTLGGSTSQERWRSTSVTSGVVNESSTVNLTYYHQYALALSYSVAGGGNPAPPSIIATYLGEPYAATVGNQTTMFLDSGLPWNITNPLTGGTSTERWFAGQPTSGEVSGPETVSLEYKLQYFLNTTFGPPSGGSIANSTGWYNSGDQVQLSATATPGWEFKGWTGSGSGSYSGQLNVTSILVRGPVSENATFYPGLTITAGPDGSVSYSLGSQSGDVPGGTSATIYAPAGTEVSLDAAPSIFVYRFSAWVPSSTGASGQATVTLESPGNVQANFALDFIVIGAVIAGLAAVALAFLVVLRRKPKHTPPGA